MSERERLPNRRASWTVNFVFRGTEHVLTYSLYEDGRLAEVFIDVQAHGMTPMSEDAKDAATCMSIAIQYGTPPEVIRSAMTRTKEGEPTGIVGCALDLLIDLGVLPKTGE